VGESPGRNARYYLSVEQPCSGTVGAVFASLTPGLLDAIAPRPKSPFADHLFIPLAMVGGGVVLSFAVELIA